MICGRRKEGDSKLWQGKKKRAYSENWEAGSYTLGCQSCDFCYPQARNIHPVPVQWARLPSQENSSPPHHDSKKLSEKKREALYDEIMAKAVATGIGMASPARIDEINILQATYEATMRLSPSLSVVSIEEPLTLVLCPTKVIIRYVSPTIINIYKSGDTSSG